MFALTDLQKSISDFGSKLLAKITAHTSNTNNPHGTTATQVGAYTKAQTDAGILAALNGVGLGGLGTSPYIADLDASTTLVSGLYYYNLSTLNVPVALANTQGMVIHKVYGNAGFQLIQAYGKDRILWRRMDANGWEAWQELANLNAPAFTGLVTFDTRPQFAGKTPWDSGNFTPAPSATTDTTNASNISSGTLATARLPADTAYLDVVQGWSKGQYGAEVTLSSSNGTTIPVDFSLSNNFAVTLNGNYTLDIPDDLAGNLKKGQSGVITVTQDATGSRTLAYSTRFKFSGGTAPVLTTTANAMDILCYYVTANGVLLSLIPNVK